MFAIYRKKIGKQSSSVDNSAYYSFESWPNPDSNAVISTISQKNEYLEYVQSPAIKKLDCNPIRYWHEINDKWPTWKIMAFDLLPIPAMSSEPERVFSRYDTLTW